MPGKSSRKRAISVIPTEYQECKTFYQYTQTVLRLGKTIVKHVNEGARVAWWGKALCAIGLTRGVCDYQYFVPNKKYHGLWIEMKRVNERDRKRRPEQDEFIATLRAHGHYACYVYGAGEAIRILEEYMADRL